MGLLKWFIPLVLLSLYLYTMTLLEAIEARHSVRRYLDKPIEAEKAQTLQAVIDECNAEGGLHIQLVLEEPRAFAGKLAHYGRFAGVKNYIALVGPDSSDLNVTLGYYGERLVLEAQCLGLNTCWVALTFSKKAAAVDIAAGEQLAAVISLGYGESQGHGHKIKRVEQVSKVDGEMPEWFRRGVEAALLAPTAINQQQFKFVLREPRTVVAKRGIGIYTQLDLGIVKYHFEVAAGRENFEWGE